MATKKTDKRNQKKQGTDTRLKPMRWEPDILAKDFQPREHPRSVPAAGIFDETIFCLRFNELWLPHILGALQLLLEPDSWSGGQSEIFRAQQSVYIMLENLTAPCGDSGENMRTPEFQSIAIDENCDQFQWKYVDEPPTAWRNLGTPICDGADGADGDDGRLPEFQLVPAGDNCQLIQWRYVGDDAWFDLGMVCDGEDGTNGTNGDDGDDGREIEIRTISAGEQCQQIQWRYVGDSTWNNSGEPICCSCDEETVPPNPGGGEFDGTACSVAINCTDELKKAWDAAWQDSAGVVSGVAAGAGTVVALLGALLGWTGVGAAVGAAAYVVINAIASWSYDQASNSFDSAAEECIRCALYCILKTNGDATFNDSVRSQWADGINDCTDIPSPDRTLIIDLLNAFPIEQFQWRAYASSEVNPAACDCVCDNDRLISWDTATSNAPEGLTHDVMIKLTSPDPLPSDVTVNIVAANGTASSADYTLLSTFIVIPAGSVDGDTFPVSVAITASDGIDNGETFTLTIDSVVGAAVIDEDHDVHTVTITDCATTGSYTINCATNNTMLQSGWTGCGGSPSVTTYNGTQSVVVTLPTSKRIKKIQVNWRSAFSPFLQIGDGKIIVAGTTYTQDVTGTGGTTSAQSVDNLYVTTNTFTIQTTGTINGSAPAGYVAFFSIVVTYCEDGG